MGEMKIEGLEEFKTKLKTIEQKAPDRILNKLDDEGRKLRIAARRNTPKVTGRLQRGYRLTPTEKVLGGYQKGLYNKAPHFHLVEKGHRRVSPGGRDLGWTEGLFMVEKTAKQEEDPIMRELQSWMDELFKELS